MGWYQRYGGWKYIAAVIGMQPGKNDFSSFRKMNALCESVDLLIANQANDELPPQKTRTKADRSGELIQFSAAMLMISASQVDHPSRAQASFSCSSQ